MENIVNMPRPEILMVADTVAREKILTVKMFLRLWKKLSRKPAVPNTGLNMIYG